MKSLIAPSRRLALIGLLMTMIQGILLASPDVRPIYSGDYTDIGGYRVYRLPEGEGGCAVYFTTIPVDVDYTVRDPTISLYQASGSITFEPGFQTAAGDAFIAQIVPASFGVPQATHLTGTADANINWIQSLAHSTRMEI